MGNCCGDGEVCIFYSMVLSRTKIFIIHDNWKVFFLTNYQELSKKHEKSHISSGLCVKTYFLCVLSDKITCYIGYSSQEMRMILDRDSWIDFYQYCVDVDNIVLFMLISYMFYLKYVQFNRLPLRLKFNLMEIH